MGPGSVQNPEISHAALIPLGEFRGRVVFWRNDGPGQNTPTTSGWIFDRVNPDALQKLSAILKSSIFCSGQTWSPEGVLVVAGGGRYLQSPTPLPPDETYRFSPYGLTLSSQGNPPCDPPIIGGNPWRMVAPLSIGTYYSTVVTLLLGDILSNSPHPSIPGASSFVIVIGGEIDGNAALWGNDWWQAFFPVPSNQWSQTLYADQDGLPCNYDPKSCLPADREEYVLRAPMGQELPDPILETYPRCFHMATTDNANLSTVKNLFIANDIEAKAKSGDCMECNDPGLSWVIKPRYDSSQEKWELWRGPEDTRESFYGNAVLRHDLNARNRVIILGGQYKMGGMLFFRDEVKELALTPGSALLQEAVWVEKTEGLSFPRGWSNAVLLPTGRILVLGGAYDFCTVNGQQRPLPACCPELYDPGDASLASGADSWLMATRPQDLFIPRHYHNVALLLPDGRVWNAGGVQVVDCSTDPVDYPSSLHNGEMFGPPYYHHPARPVVNSVSPPEEIEFEQSFDIEIGYEDPMVYDEVTRFVLLRPAALTHHFDNDQRYVELSLSAPPEAVDPLTQTQVFHVTAPEDDLGPPGYYMLFAIRPTGEAVPVDEVPSQEGWFIRLIEPSP